MHHSGQELTFEDIDIKTIFQPVEHSLDIIKDLFRCDFNTEAKISQDLAITPNTSIRKKSYEKKDITIDKLEADTIIDKNIVVARDTPISVKSHEKNFYNSSGSQPGFDKIFTLKPCLASPARASERSGSNKKCSLPVYSKNRCMKKKSHFSRKTTTVYNAKCASEVSSNEKQNCSNPALVEQRSALKEPHKTMIILRHSADEEECCNSSPLTKKRKTQIGQHYEDVCLRLYQAMEESKSSHCLLNDWDEKVMGLKRSHSKTMSLSTQSRDHLRWSLSPSEVRKRTQP